MTYGSCCSGIEAVTEAWGPLGFRPAFFAEIDPFACKVLAWRHGATRPECMPEPCDTDTAEQASRKRAAIRAVAGLPATGSVPNRGDFTTLKGDEYGAIDLLVAGTPCQDFSVAGLRAGMDGKRGQLTVEFAYLAHRMAAWARTRWVLWENVPGVLSVDGGRAFALFLSILSGRTVQVPGAGWRNSGIVEGADGSFGLCYRVLDAQHFGVPQRRRRVFVAGYLGDWRRAAAVLLEWHSLSGDTPPRREAGQSAPTIPARSLGGGGLRTDFDCDGGLVAKTMQAGGHSTDPLEETLICMSTGQGSAEIGIGIGTTLNCNHEAPIVTHSLRGEGFDASEDGTGRGTPLVAVVTAPLTQNPYGDNESRESLLVAFDTTQISSKANRSAPKAGDPCHPLSAAAHAPAIAFDCKASRRNGFAVGEISPTLRAMGHLNTHSNAGGQVAVAFRAAGQDGFTPSGVCPPVSATDGGGAGVPTVAINLRGREGGAMPELDHLASLRAASGGSSRSYIAQMAVRRLTPREAERLQGFADDHTMIGEKTADGPRYRALGNSMAVPVMRWIGERMQRVDGLCGEVLG